VETDARFYRRRAAEELAGASRAVTEPARRRRLELVDSYLARLATLGEPCPPDLVQVQTMLRQRASKQCSAFGWQDPEPRADP
jgi:hypothetical protein